MGLNGYIPKPKKFNKISKMCIGPVEYNIEKMEDIDICRLYRDNFDCHRGRGVAGLLLQRRQGSYDISFN